MINMQQRFEHVVIIGCGLLGTSLGMALRRRGLARTVTGVGRRGSESLRVAHERGGMDRASDDAASAIAGDGGGKPADLVVVCTPVRTFPEVFRQMSPALAEGTIVTDVGSTKVDVMRWAAEFLPGEPRVHFIGAHPMAGSEKNGPEAAREDLYENGACLICRPAGTSARSATRVSALWRAVGMRVIECTAQEHDAWVAAVSHLPHAIASSLVKTAMHDPDALETAASGFIDTSRIASGDVTMWTDIFMTNREPVVQIIDDFLGELRALQDAVKRGNEAAIRNLLSQAKSARDAFITKRKAMATARQVPVAGQEG